LKKREKSPPDYYVSCGEKSAETAKARSVVSVISVSFVLQVLPDKWGISPCWA